jgi:streptogramin lyase
VAVFSSILAVVAVGPLTSAASVGRSSHDAPLPVGRGPCCLAVAGGSIWLGVHRDGAVEQVDPKTDKVVSSMGGSLAFDYGDLLAIDGKIWLLQLSFPKAPRPPLTRIDPTTHRRTVVPGLVAPTAFAATGDSIWVSSIRDPSLREVDARTGRVKRTIRVPGVRNTVIGLATPKSLWLTGVDNFQPVIDRVDPHAGKVDLHLKPFAHDASVRGIALVGNSLWVSAAASHGPTLVRLDTRTNRITRTSRPKTTGNPSAFPAVVAPGDGTLWLQTGPHSITQIDPANGRSIRRVVIPLDPGRPIADYWNSAMVAGFGSYWVTSYPGTGGLSDPSVGTLIRVNRP